MKNQLAAIELAILVGELKAFEGSRLDQVYGLAALGSAGKDDGKSLVFQFSGSEAAKRFIVAMAPSAMFGTMKKPAVSEPGGFCTLLRHHLGNARLSEIRQRGTERIIELVFLSLERQQTLVIELFSKGNVLLLDGSGLIVGVAQQQVWKDRTIRPGFAYAPPPATFDLRFLTQEGLAFALLSSDKDSVVKALATSIGLSGTYAEALCALSGLDKGKAPKGLDSKETDALYSSLRRLLEEAPRPLGVKQNGILVEVLPFPLPNAPAELVRFESFNEAVEAIALARAESAFSTARQLSSSRKIREMEIALEQQQSTIAAMELGAMENARAAELIYERYQDVQQLLAEYNTLRKTFSPEQLKDYFKSNKLVQKIDEKSGTITIDMG